MVVTQSSVTNELNKNLELGICDLCGIHFLNESPVHFCGPQHREKQALVYEVLKGFTRAAPTEDKCKVRQ